jgi:hypothetical protein
MKQVAFLGHVISMGGISIDSSKVQDVLSWKAPTIVGDIQSFLDWLDMINDLLKDFQR